MRTNGQWKTKVLSSLLEKVTPSIAKTVLKQLCSRRFDLGKVLNFRNGELAPAESGEKAFQSKVIVVAPEAELELEELYREHFGDYPRRILQYATKDIVFLPCRKGNCSCPYHQHAHKKRNPLQLLGVNSSRYKSRANLRQWPAIIKNCSRWPEVREYLFKDVLKSVRKTGYSNFKYHAES